MSEKEYIKESMKQYILLDSTIQRYETKLKELKKQRTVHSDNLKSFLLKKGKQELSSKANNIYFKLHENTVKQSLSQNFLQSALQSYFESQQKCSKSQAKQSSVRLLKYINSKRSSTKKTTLKRIKRRK